MSKPQGKLRIIGGKWRSRVLPVVDLPGLRPTTDRVRETLFNWLQDDISGARCLDLFAGSGALGFEAASRGAASTTMLEVQSKASAVLAENIKTLKADNIQLVRQDAITWLNAGGLKNHELTNNGSENSASQPFDIIFLDPPFDSDLLEQACDLLERQQCLSEHAYIYLEMDDKQSLPVLPVSWSIQKEKKAGQVRYYLVQRSED